ncbi:MAG TPA: DUF6527 family protein [Burkholderiaceae bacterium]|nr:DUF6527 family protein [Burkholderiaceae bacterium]
MSTNSCAARRVAGLWVNVIRIENYAPMRGDFEILEDDDGPKSIALCCPGCGSVSLLNLRPGSGPDWQFDGNHDKPTLQPSIHHLQCWHGWLRAGQFVSC